MTEQLRSVLGNIADMKTAPDADIAYLTDLETQILRYLRAPFEAQRMQAQLGGPQQAGPAAQAGGPPGMPGGAAPVPPGGGVPGGAAPVGGGQPPGAAAQLLLAMGAPVGRQARIRGVMQGHTMPNADELRRLMEQPAL
jgi:hypothetical protein